MEANKQTRSDNNMTAYSITIDLSYNVMTGKNDYQYIAVDANGNECIVKSDFVNKNLTLNAKGVKECNEMWMLFRPAFFAEMVEYRAANEVHEMAEAFAAALGVAVPYCHHTNYGNSYYFTITEEQAAKLNLQLSVDNNIRISDHYCGKARTAIHKTATNWDELIEIASLLK